MTSKQNKARSKKKTTADAVVFVATQRAQQCSVRRESAAVPSSHAPHGVRRGCDWQRIAGIHGEAMYAALTLRSACSSSSYRPAMSGVEGEGPSFFLSEVTKGDTLFREREYPPFTHFRTVRKHPRACAEQFANRLIKPFPESRARHKRRSPMRARASA